VWQQACAPYADHGWLAAIPPSLAHWLLPVGWDREALWALPKASVQLQIADLRWLYDLPLWRGADGCWFQVTPREYLASPTDYPEHDARVRSVDLRYPLHAISRHDHWFLLDGAHRLVRADLDRREHVEVVVVSPDDLPTFVRAPGT
jgi:hypothetical protein